MTDETKHGRSSAKPMRHPDYLCGLMGVRDDKFDAYYCPVSGVWLENACSDEECKFCPHRPPKKEV